jgi:hypothetical protein
LIACLIAVLAVQGHALVQLPDPAATKAEIQAVVMLPKLTADEHAFLEIATAAMPLRTREYSSPDMLRTTGGEPVVVDLMPDSVRIGIEVSPDNLADGFSILENLLFQASLTDDDLVASSKEAFRPTAWMAAMWPEIYPRNYFRTDRVRTLYEKVFDVDFVTVGIGGNYDPVKAESLWLGIASRHPAARKAPYRDDYSVSKPRPSAEGPLNMLSIRRPAVADPATILALFALGSGKGASVFRVIREQMRLSYRQEAVLMPTPNGFESVILAASTQKLDRNAVVKALQDDVDKWTESDRLRAIGMAGAVLNQGLDFSPFYFSPGGPLSASPADEVYLRAYWFAKTGQIWDPNALLASLKSVDLVDLRATAKRCLG